MIKNWIVESLSETQDYEVVSANFTPPGAICLAPEGATTADGKYISVEEVDQGGLPTLTATLDTAQKASDEAAQTAAEAAAAPLESAKAAIKSAMRKGDEIIQNFAAENVLLGITADGMTGTVLDIMAPVTNALRAGSLYEAIDRLKAIDPADKDAKYITDARLLAAVNEIEEFLGIELSETL